MFNRFYYFAIDLRSIFSKSNGLRISKGRLFATYLKFRIKLALHKTFHLNWSEEKFFGLRMSIFLYGDFFTLWREIFVWGNYFFESRTERPIIIDAGSNIGMSVLFFKFLYPEAHITCFEPDPDSFEMLKRNIAINHFSDVSAHNVALSDNDEPLTLYRSTSRGGAGHTTKTYLRLEDKPIATQVISKKLSTFIKTNVDFLKIDVEGAEYQVLRDLKTKLSLVDRLAVEIHRPDGEDKLSEMFSILENAELIYSISIPLSVNTHYDLIKSATNTNYALMLDAWRKHV